MTLGRTNRWGDRLTSALAAEVDTYVACDPNYALERSCTHCVHTQIHTHTHAYIPTHTYMSAHAHIRTYTCKSAHTQTCVHIHIHIYRYIHRQRTSIQGAFCIYAYMYIHTHTQTCLLVHENTHVGTWKQVCKHRNTYTHANMGNTP